ncbi:MAG: hypothetical protein F9K29_09070 [Hyphomicrobiaceae bacterium]|nr:MAG: hypothetical protein F9K29_09070 [Hyphomicrobiaceae bacterium]
MIGIFCGSVALARLPSPLVLPVLSTLLVVAGFSMAAILYLAGSRIGKMSSPAWQIAGALVFLGFAAAILSDSEQALGLLDKMQTPGEGPR